MYIQREIECSWMRFARCMHIFLHTHTHTYKHTHTHSLSHTHTHTVYTHIYSICIYTQKKISSTARKEWEFVTSETPEATAAGAGGGVRVAITPHKLMKLPQVGIKCFLGIKCFCNAYALRPNP